MLRSINRVVVDLRAHAAVARQLSVGVYEAVAVLARGYAEIEAAFRRHDARVQTELPGF